MVYHPSVACLGLNWLWHSRPVLSYITYDKKPIQLSVMDVLAPTTMKDAAKCDTQCELQNSVNHQVAERKRRSRDIPERMYVSVFPKTP